MIKRFTTIYLPALIFLTIIAIWTTNTVVPIQLITRDIAMIGSLPFFAGMMSTLGIIFWSMTLGVIIVGVSVSSGRPKKKIARQFLMCMGILTAMLLIDDAFLIHEISPIVFKIPSNVFYIIYALSGLFAFWRCRSFIFENGKLLLLTAGGCLFMSILIDVLHDAKILKSMSIVSEHWIYFFEDGFKFLGIVGWFGYFTYTVKSLIYRPKQKIAATGNA